MKLPCYVALAAALTASSALAAGKQCDGAGWSPPYGPGEHIWTVHVGDDYCIGDPSGPQSHPVCVRLLELSANKIVFGSPDGRSSSEWDRCSDTIVLRGADGRITGKAILQGNAANLFHDAEAGTMAVYDPAHPTPKTPDAAPAKPRRAAL